MIYIKGVQPTYKVAYHMGTLSRHQYNTEPYPMEEWQWGCWGRPGSRTGTTSSHAATLMTGSGVVIRETSSFSGLLSWLDQHPRQSFIPHTLGLVSDRLRIVWRSGMETGFSGYILEGKKLFEAIGVRNQRGQGFLLNCLQLNLSNLSVSHWIA